MESEVNKCIAVVKQYLKVKDPKYRDLESNLRFAAKVCFKNFYKSKVAILKPCLLYLIYFFVSAQERRDR